MSENFVSKIIETSHLKPEDYLIQVDTLNGCMIQQPRNWKLDTSRVKTIEDVILLLDILNIGYTTYNGKNLPEKFIPFFVEVK